MQCDSCKAEIPADDDLDMPEDDARQLGWDYNGQLLCPKCVADAE
jgi:hypothetical protein